MAAACASAVAPSPRPRRRLASTWYATESMNCPAPRCSRYEVARSPAASQSPAMKSSSAHSATSEYSRRLPRRRASSTPSRWICPARSRSPTVAENRSRGLQRHDRRDASSPCRASSSARSRVVDLGIRVAVSALSEAEGDPGHENLLGGAELLGEREDSRALLERDALARKQGGTPGESADPCGDARLRKVRDECDRPLVVRERRLLLAAEAVDIAEVGLGLRGRLDLAGGPEPIGGLLQLRDSLRPQPGRGLSPAPATGAGSRDRPRARARAPWRGTSPRPRAH